MKCSSPKFLSIEAPKLRRYGGRTKLFGRPLDVVTAGTPFIPEIGPSASIGDSELGAMAGVRARVIKAFRTSVPLWELERNYRKVAAVIGVEPHLLRAKIAAAKNVHFGRREGPGGPSPFSKLRP